jgi:hypothetical protein
MDNAPASFAERLSDGFKIKRSVNGVTRARMIERESEACRSRLSGSGSPERDARRRVASQACEWVGHCELIALL